MKLFGASAITTYFGDRFYVDEVSAILRTVNAPKAISERGVAGFCITTQQADKLKKMIIEMREVMKHEG